jgi:hypothetical protein
MVGVRKSCVSVKQVDSLQPCRLGMVSQDCLLLYYVLKMKPILVISVHKLLPEDFYGQCHQSLKSHTLLRRYNKKGRHQHFCFYLSE